MKGKTTPFGVSLMEEPSIILDCPGDTGIGKTKRKDYTFLRQCNEKLGCPGDTGLPLWGALVCRLRRFPL